MTKITYTWTNGLKGDNKQEVTFTNYPEVKAYKAAYGGTYTRHYTEGIDVRTYMDEMKGGDN